VRLANSGRSQWLGATLFGAACILVVPGLRAEGTGSAPGRSPAQWLQSIQQAAQRANYTGTIVYQRGDEVRSSRLIHFFDGKTASERVQTLDGRPREFIRQGDEVRCLYPQLRRVIVEHAGRRASFPALGDAGAGSVLEHYSLRSGARERVAGVECQVLQFYPMDALRYGYRLCIDPNSGLLLKVQVLAHDEGIIEQIAFSDVHIGEAISPGQLKPSFSTAGWEVVRRESRAVELSQQGWSVTAPSGFWRLTEIERQLGADAEHSALQAVYSDGLATVSVFIEPGATLPADADAQASHGPLSAVTRQVADARVTVVGEVPPATARFFADSVRFVAVH